jgi:hypothetical protein
VVHSMLCGRLLFPILDNKAHAHSQAINPDEFTAAKCSPDRRKDQEKFLRLKDVGGALNFESGSRRGNIPQQTLSSPCPIDRHYVYWLGEMFKSNTIRFSTFPCHRQSSVAVSSKLDASQKAVKQETVWRVLRRVATRFEIGGSDEKMSMAIQTIVIAQAATLAPGPLNNSLISPKSAIGIWSSAFYANRSAPAWVKRTKVPLSCSTSQPLSIV